MSRPSALFMLFALLALLVACGGGEEAPGVPEAASQGVEATPAPEAEASSLLTLVFLGDSLTAGYGLTEEEAFPALLGEKLDEAGLSMRVVNAGESGATSAGGLARLDWLLRQEPALIVVGLGGNDGLRGLDLPAMEANLRAIVERSREGGARVLLLGMMIPPNMGPEYSEGFQEVYPRVAEELEVPFVPFLLEGVAGDPAFNLPDGIHPNAEGQRLLAENVWPYLEPLVRELSESP